MKHVIDKKTIIKTLNEALDWIGVMLTPPCQLGR